MISRLIGCFENCYGNLYMFFLNEIFKIPFVFIASFNGNKGFSYSS